MSGQQEQNVEEMRQELFVTKQILNEQIEKFEKLDLLTRKLKQDNRILEKFFRIEMRSPQDIMDEFRTGKISDAQLLSGYSTDNDQKGKEITRKAVSQFNLAFEANIY